MKCGAALPEPAPLSESDSTGAALNEPVQANYTQAQEQQLPPPVYPTSAGEIQATELPQSQAAVAQPANQRPDGAMQAAHPYPGAQSGASRTYQAPALPPVNISALHIWSPFAGYGARRRHVGWLLDNRGDSAEILHQKISQKFSERAIPNASVTQETLKSKGILVENRVYFLLHRGLVTMGLYVTKFGQDLYLSLVSYLKPPISNLRVAVLGLMAIFWLFFVTGYISALNNSLTRLANSIVGSLGSALYGGNAGLASTGSLAFLLCVIGPLGAIDSLLLFLFVAYSLWKFITEKDILAGLRVKPNEFNEDDLMALEKAVEQTVHQSMDEIGLDFSLARETSIPEGRII